MKIFDFGGNYNEDLLSNLDRMFSRRYGGFNEITIVSDNIFPHLTVLIRDELAALFFVERDMEAGYSSVGSELEVDRSLMTTFETGSPGEEIDVSNEALVPLSLARVAAKEFLQSMRLPQSVQWLKL